MELSQFKIKSFIIGVIVLGVLITVVSFGINQIYKTFVKSQENKVAVVTSSTPIPSGSSPRALTTPGKSPSPNPKQSPSPNPKQTPSPTATPKPTPTTTTVTNQPSTGSDDIKIKNPGITIDNVRAGDTINSGYEVAGRANVTNTKVIIEIIDIKGNVLGTSQANGCLGYDACSFSTTINFEKVLDHAGYLYAYNPADNGTRLYEVKIPINF